MTEQPVTEEKSSRSGYIFLILAILILMGCFGYGYFAVAKVNLQLTQMAMELQKRETNGQQDITGLQHTVKDMQQSIQKAQELSTQQEQLLSEWHAAQAGDLSKWHVAHAQYLIKMANDQLQFAHEITIVMQLLQQADKELQSSQDPMSVEVRKSLALDIANLQVQPPVDVTSLFIRLNAIDALVDKLPLPISPLKPDHEQNTTKDSQTSLWKAGLVSAWEGLNKIVIIRKNDASALPLVMPEEKIFIYQNLHAQLETARWGLLHANAVIYTTSLARAVAWIQQYFVQEAQETKTVLQQLTELQKINIQPTVMTLTNTLQLFDGNNPPVKTGQ